VTTPEEPFRAPGGLAVPPLFRGFDFFNPPPPRGFMTLTPSLTLGGEYNDNLDLESSDKNSDWIGRIIPGLTVAMLRPDYEISGGYNLGVNFYAENSDRNGVDSQQLYLDALYRISPRVSFTLSERFVYNIESNVVSSSGLSVGRRDSYANTVGANLAFLATPRTTLNVFGSYSLLRYEDISGTDAQDSDTYRGGAGVAYLFTPRFTGRLDFAVGYLNPEDDPSVVTYTALAGGTYQFTRTLTASVNGGATVTVGQLESGGQDETTVTPSGSANIEQTFTYGSVGLGYAHAITSEATGVSETQTAFATLRLATRRRDLQFQVTPSYAHTNRPDGGDDNDTFNLSLGVIYQFARNFALTGGYNFYRQQGGGGLGDVTQNRVFLGLQYVYPINID
jgi:hypothetical protein